MKELEQRITENRFDYILIGDYYYPDLELPKDEEPHYGKYGSMRLDYIKEHHFTTFLKNKITYKALSGV